MSEKPRTRTVRKEEYRAKHKARYHRCSFITEYIRKKYQPIYKEADDFYQKLYQLYPNKTKLTTCVEFKRWEKETKITQPSTTITRTPRTHEETTTRMDEETATQTTSINNIQINIPLMNAEGVQQSKDMVMFEGIYPSVIEQINPEILEEIICELQQSDITCDMFNNINNDDHHDEDLNDIINSAINDSLNELSELEKELFIH